MSFDLHGRVHVHSLSFAAQYSSTRDAKLLTMTFPECCSTPWHTVFLFFQISQHKDKTFSIKPEHIDLCCTNCHTTSTKLHLLSIQKGKTSLLLLQTSFILSQNQNKCRLVSDSFPHSMQMSSLVICLLFKFDLVARASRQALQAKHQIL